MILYFQLTDIFCIYSGDTVLWFYFNYEKYLNYGIEICQTSDGPQFVTETVIVLSLASSLL